MNPYIRDYQDVKYETGIIEDIHTFKHDSKLGKINILHLNIRSIAKNLDELLILLDYLTVKFDIIVLSETFQINNSEIFNISGYRTIYSNGTLNKNDGVLVYIRKDIECTHNIITLGENKSVEINIAGDNSLTLTAIYKSPQTCVHTFNTNIFDYLESKCQVKTHMIVGDMNINLLADDEFVEEYKNIMCTFGYMSVINEITRPGGNTCIDHIFLKDVNLENRLQHIKGYILHYLITDHFSIMVTFESGDKTLFHKKAERKVRKYIMITIRNYEKIYVKKHGH